MNQERSIILLKVNELGTQAEQIEMNPWRAMAAALMFSAILASSGRLSAWAADKKQSANERHQAERIDAARREVAIAGEQLQAARKSLQSTKRTLADARERQAEAVKSLRETRQRVENTLEQKLGMPAAIEAHQAAEKVFQTLAGPVISRLKETDSYRAAATEAVKARAQLERLRGDTADGSPESEEMRLALLAATQRPAQLENEAINADRTVVEARQAMLEQQAKAAVLRAEVHSGMDGDRSVRAALAAVERQNQKVDQLTAEAAQKKRQLDRAQTRIGRARQAVEEATRMDRKDDDGNRKRDRNSRGNGR